MEHLNALSFISLQEVAVVLGAAWLAIHLYTLIKDARFSGLNSVPGPTLAAWTDYYALYQNFKGRKYLRVHEAFEKYGSPVIRIGPTTVSIADYRFLNPVYQKKLDKIPAYAGFSTNGGVENAFSAISAHVAQGKRKGMLPHYATAALTPYQGTFDTHITELVKVLTEYGSEKSVDVLSLLAHTLVDVLGEVILDTDIGALTDYAQGKRNPVCRAITLWPKRGTIKGQVPGFVWKLMSLVPIAKWQDVVQSDANLAKFVGPKVIRARAAMAGGGHDGIPALSHRLSSATDPNTGKLWAEDAVIAECIDHFLAGTETTSVSVSYALFMLSQHPAVLASLQSELDEHMAADEVLDIQTAARLPWLNAVLKETLRLCTPGPGTFDRIVPHGGMEVAGHYLPAGVSVGLQSYTCHRDPEVWGADVLDYKPERWFAETAAMKQAFIPFSVGGRACPGLNLAFVDMRLITSAVIRNFNVKAAPETTFESMTPFDLATIVPMSGECKLHLIKRED